MILLPIALLALLAVGCETDTSNPLKPPSVYRDPKVRVTHAPTETDAPTLEAGASATTEPVFIQPPGGSSVDEEQFLMDEIERLLSKMERKLDQTDVNP